MDTLSLIIPHSCSVWGASGERKQSFETTSLRMGEGKIDMEQQPPPYPHNQVGMSNQWAPVALDKPMPPKVGKSPEIVTCNNCRSQVQTRVNRNLSQNGWIWSIVLW